MITHNHEFYRKHPKIDTAIWAVIVFGAFIFIVPVLFIFQQAWNFIAATKDFWNDRVEGWICDWQHVEDQFSKFKKYLGKMWRKEAL